MACVWSAHCGTWAAGLVHAEALLVAHSCVSSVVASGPAPSNNHKQQSQQKTQQHIITCQAHSSFVVWPMPDRGSSLDRRASMPPLGQQAGAAAAAAAAAVDSLQDTEVIDYKLGMQVAKLRWEVRRCLARAGVLLHKTHACVCVHACVGACMRTRGCVGACLLQGCRVVVLLVAAIARNVVLQHLQCKLVSPGSRTNSTTLVVVCSRAVVGSWGRAVMCSWVRACLGAEAGQLARHLQTCHTVR